MPELVLLVRVTVTVLHLVATGRLLFIPLLGVRHLGTLEVEIGTEEKLNFMLGNLEAKMSSGNFSETFKLNI